MSQENYLHRDKQMIYKILRYTFQEILSCVFFSQEFLKCNVHSNLEISRYFYYLATLRKIGFWKF